MAVSLSSRYSKLAQGGFPLVNCHHNHGHYHPYPRYRNLIHNLLHSIFKKSPESLPYKLLSSLSSSLLLNVIIVTFNIIFIIIIIITTTVVIIIINGLSESSLYLFLSSLQVWVLREKVSEVVLSSRSPPSTCTNGLGVFKYCC